MTPDECEKRICERMDGMFAQAHSLLERPNDNAGVEKAIALLSLLDLGVAHLRETGEMSERARRLWGAYAEEAAFLRSEMDRTLGVRR